MTPATRSLDAGGVAYTVHQFAHDPAVRDYGAEAAAALRSELGTLEADQVFKTLLVVLDGATTAVAIAPVTCQLSLKATAAALGAKRAELCAAPVAERTTGYVVGGISPFGQRKLLATAIDETCHLWDTIYVSGGRRGLDIGVAPGDLIDVLDAAVAPIVA